MNEFIAGIDGGGTKTECLLSDREGNILGRGFAGSSNPRNQGLEETVKNITESIRKAIGKKRGVISSLFIGLAAAEEEYSSQLNLIRKRLSKDDQVEPKSIFFGSDQEVAFRSGTDEDDGIVVISGTGSVIRGWRDQHSVKAGGWGYLADEGSAFWVGQRAYQAIAKDLDGRGKKTIMTKLVGIKDMNDLNSKIYKNPLSFVPSLSIVVDEAVGKKDRVALAIINEAIHELFSGVLTVIKQLEFSREFPLVISGGMFKSKRFKKFFKERIKNKVPLARFIVPAESPAFGSLKLAMEIINEKKAKRNR